MNKCFILLSFIICVAVYADAREGIIKLKNGHALSGDITVLKDKRILLKRNNGSVFFSKEEIRSVEYAKKSLVEKKDELEQFLQALKNTPNIKNNTHVTYDYLIYKASQRHDLDPALIKAVVEVESGFNHRGVSRKGAEGLMQLMPQTARSLGVKNSFDPKENIYGGSRYLRKMLDLFGGDLNLALAAYNAGPEAVKKYDSIPPYRETKAYIKKVIQCYNSNKSDIGFYEYKDANGCLYLSNYLKNSLYRPVK